MTLTGSQIKDMLEQQWLDPKRPRILQVSNGFSVTPGTRRAIGERVIDEKMTLNGSAIDPGERLPRHREQLSRRRRRRLYGRQTGHRAAIWRLRRRRAVRVLQGAQTDRAAAAEPHPPRELIRIKRTGSGPPFAIPGNARLGFAFAFWRRMRQATSRARIP